MIVFADGRTITTAQVSSGKMGNENTCYQVPRVVEVMKLVDSMQTLSATLRTAKTV